ncbi:hypothetical protein LY78DRAFT_697907 [Colletotrichum sublineola]|nr:hypothetical protein LY78DRAFT_697907 [Colletotrichum sublineola]
MNPAGPAAAPTSSSTSSSAYPVSTLPSASGNILAGRFRGKRVVLLKTLDQGVLLVTGPFKINGVPLRHVNSRYVIATSYKEIEEISQPKYFTADKAKKQVGEDAFFKQGEKPQFIIQYSSSKEAMKEQNMLLNNLNLVLISILKQEWPHNWPAFINVPFQPVHLREQHGEIGVEVDDNPLL